MFKMSFSSGALLRSDPRWSHLKSNQMTFWSPLTPNLVRYFHLFVQLSFEQHKFELHRSSHLRFFFQYTVNHLYHQISHPQIQPTSDKKIVLLIPRWEFGSIEDWLYSLFCIILHKWQEHPQILEFVGS